MTTNLQREIKFRAWDKKEKKMYSDVGVADQYNVYSYNPIGELWNRIPYEVVVMQYTGLKDKNGKEIYEGDIVQVFTKEKREPAYLVTIKDIREGFVGVGNGEGEVIGNIYENKGLPMTTNLQREEKCPQCGGYLREWFDHQVSTGFKCDDCQLELKEIPTNPPTETVSDCCGAGFHTQSNAGIDNDTVDKICNKCGNPCLTIVNPPTKPRECNCIDCRVGRDLGLKTKVKPTVEKWENILKKAEKYVRANSVYYGNDQYRLSMTDWLYFIKGVANEIHAHSLQQARDKGKEDFIKLAESKGYSQVRRISDLLTKEEDK